MADSVSLDLLTQIPAFAACSRITLERIRSEGKLVRFGVGHIMSSGQIVPNRVLLQLNGRARLLGQHNGKLNTLALLKAGNLIGVASLLRGEGCEEVSAATALDAWSIPDTLIADIYSSDKAFNEWCKKTVFPAEVAKLLDSIIQKSERSTCGLLDVLSKAMKVVKTQIPVDRLESTSKNELAFAASVHSGNSLNTEIESIEDINNSPNPFDPRVLLVPQSIIKEIQGGSSDSNDLAEKQVKTNSEDHGALSLPSRTSLELDGKDPRDTLKIVYGKGELNESLASLEMLAKIMGIPFRRDSLEKSIRDSLQRGQKPSAVLLAELISGMGLLCTGATIPSSFCTRLNVPCIIQWEDSFGLIVKSNANGCLMAHPRLGWIEITPEEISNANTKGLDIIQVSQTNYTQESKFGLSWFVPAIKRYKSTLLIVLGSSFVVQLFSLANPLIIQVIIDKVISQRSLDTLEVLGIALVAVTIFEGLLSSLRTFLFVDTTNRIDMRLGAEVIDHLLRLPVGYFDKRPVGELGTRIAELEKIRNFLTGEALTTIIDAAFSIIYIIVMALYSWVLTLVALIVVPLQVGITLLGAPLFRKQFRQSAKENAKTQSHLMEVLTGIQTVKAQNVELVSRWKWQERYSAYISRTFEKTITGTALGQIGQVLQKLSQLMVLWVGATLVLKGELSLGQLIAFRIISSYVTQPLLRLSTIWQRIQELKVSFERLADIVDTPEESNQTDKQKIALPPVKGEVIIEDLDFRFDASKPQVLKNINIKIPAGTFVGVVGQSGSGKSTLMKLISRLYAPNNGKILIDGYDVDKVELYSLRRQIGIVPQDPLLFSGSVSENISLTDPNARDAEITNAAEISCAHEFIMGLDSGYSTQLGERATSLSGGQRQRLAIARTLLANPKLLIMDEATSALDYDTERRVCQNLRESLKACTVFFVTHRLSTVRNADKIMMMHQGAVVEVGTHAELMEQQGRYYALYRQQEAS